MLPTALIGAAFLLVAVIFAASSSWYLTFKAVHVIFAVVWIGGGLMLTILGVIAERRERPGRTGHDRTPGLDGRREALHPASIIVLLAGIAMMMNVDWGWDHFWIVFGLIGFASTFVIGIGILAPTSKRVRRVIEASGPGIRRRLRRPSRGCCWSRGSTSRC